MATITGYIYAVDGLDINVTLEDATRHTFHFVAEPDDWQAAVDDAEAALMAALYPPETVEVETEIGSIV